MHVDRNERGKKKKVRARKRIARVSRKLRIHGLSIGRNVLPMVDNVAVTAECPGQNESSERNTRDAYAGNVFPCAFCFSLVVAGISDTGSGVGRKEADVARGFAPRSARAAPLPQKQEDVSTADGVPAFVIVTFLLM